tara:strand:- start:619 stop:1380 length:762 start_codon:yes stop_codon:yes gene_type:complete
MNILIAIPCFGGQLYTDFFTSLLKLSDELRIKNIKFEIQTIQNESLITRARNSFCAIFLENPQFTHLLFLDNDLIFNPTNVIELIESGHEIVGCSYPKKNINWDKVKHYSVESIDFIKVMSTDMNYNLKPNAKGECKIINGFIEALDIPTGMMLIDKRSLAAIVNVNRQYHYKNNVAGYKNKNTFYDLFRTGVIDGIYLSEDYYFCRLAIDAGIDLYLNLNATLGHIGNMQYYGNLGSCLKFSNDSLNLDSRV